MKGRKGKATGGTNEPEEDLKVKPEARTDAKKVDSEAEEMKKGGRAKRKHGGKTEMKVSGEKAMHHAGRKPRKSGGRAGSDSNPFTSARKGTQPKGREVMKGEEGFGQT
jgi:hypothetical protein